MKKPSSSHSIPFDFLDAAHALRTPLTVIKTHLALAAGSESLSDSQHQTIASVDDAANTLKKALEDLSIITKHANSELSLTEQTNDIAELMEQAIQNMDNEVEANDATINYVYKESKVSCDGEKMITLFMRLIDNAVRFSDDNIVRVRIDSGVVTISQKGTLQIEQPFMPFAGAGSAKGVGLGLSAAKAITEAHGFSIELEQHNGAVRAVLNVS